MGVIKSNKVVTGMCIDCPRNVNRILVDGLRCASCFHKLMGYWPEYVLPEPPLPVGKPSKTKAKQSKAKKPKTKRPRRPRPELAIWSGSELALHVLAMKAQLMGQFHMSLYLWVRAAGATSDVGRLVGAMGPGSRDNAQFIKTTAKALGWTEDYTHAVYRSFLDWEEAQLTALLDRGLLRGRNFLEEAAHQLGWTRAVTWNTYRRLKRKGGKREKQSKDIIIELLAQTEEMSINELATKMNTANRWVFQVLTTKLVEQVDYRVIKGRRYYRLKR